MLISTEVELTWTNNRKIYEPKGYQYNKQGNKFIVKIDDLALNSHAEVIVQCDYCGKKYSKLYFQFNKSHKIINKDACDSCRDIKFKESVLEKYGVPVHNQCINPFERVNKEFNERNYELLPCNKIIKNKTILQYICRLHHNEIRNISYKDFKNGQGCKQCGIEKQRLSQTTPFEKIIYDFSLKDYVVTGEFYKNNRRYITYICLKHKKHGEQKICYSSFNQGHGCKYCDIERKTGETSPNWKGGITPLHNHLRTIILPWKIDSRNSCNNKCVITGKSSVIIHHLYGFNFILKELIDELKLNIDFIKNKVEDLSKKHLKQIEDKCLELHYKYGLGICLSDDIHKLYHSIYSYGNNTPSQFEEFCQRYYNVEFNNLLIS